MTTPTADQLRAMSNLNYDRLGYSDNAKLQKQLDRAAAYVVNVTGQTLEAPVPVAPLSVAGLELLIEQCIQLRTEQIVLQSQADHAESAAQNEVVQSFSAGLYSESRRDPNAKRVRLNTWPQLDELLTQSMTPDRLVAWTALVTGEVVPYWDVVEMQWHTDVLGALTWYEAWDTLLPVGTP